MDRIRQEPVVFISTLEGLCVAVLALLVGQDVIDSSESALILGIISAVLILVGFFIRGQVSPVPPEG